MTLLGVYRKSYYSQHGEDGITEEIIRRLGIEHPGWCVEFGAWDGKHLSNTIFLVEQHGWNAVYLEGHTDRMKDLLNTCVEYPKIVPLFGYVAQDSDSALSLDNLLGATKAPKDIDLLSIDIDSYDLLVWESLKNYTAKIVIIETNDQYGPDRVFRYSPTPEGVDNPGSSFAAIQESAVQLGYTLVAHTGNSFYVRNDLIDLIGLPQSHIDNPKLLFRA